MTFRYPIYKTANTKTSFIVEFSDGTNGKKRYQKLCFVLVKLNENKKALLTLTYYLDIPAAKNLCHDLHFDKFAVNQETKGFKKSNSGERSLSVKRMEGNEVKYRIAIGGSSKDNPERQSLYFDFGRDIARQIAISFLDFMKNYELINLYKFLSHPDSDYETSLAASTHPVEQN